MIRQLWHVFHEVFKQGLLCGGAGPGIVYILHHGEPACPVILIIVSINSKVLFKPLIGML
jgi:hypothetical protein